MKYKISIEKIGDELYTATCLAARKLKGRGDSIDSALNNLHQQMVCYLHDYYAEMDVVMEEERRRQKQARDKYKSQYKQK